MNILEQIQQKGYRLTQARREIITVLKHHPQTAQEIYKKLLRKKLTVDLASVYRSLKLFVDMGFVQTVEFGEGKKRYEMINGERHHHHIICNKCGSIEDVSLNESSFLRQIHTNSRYKVSSHSLEFFGLCPNCQL